MTRICTWTLLPLLLGIAACASDPADTGSSESDHSADDKRTAPSLGAPIRTSELAGREIRLPTSGRTVTILGAGVDSPSGSDCTMDLDEITRRLDAEVGAGPADPSSEKLVITVHFDFKYQGWGVCYGDGSDCQLRLRFL